MPRVTTTLPVLASAASMLAVPSAPVTVMVPAFATEAVPAPVVVRRWPLGVIVRAAVFSSIAVLPVPAFRISEPPVHDIWEPLVNVAAVNVPPDMTKSSAVFVRLVTTSLPDECSTCGSSAKSMTTSLLAMGTTPSVQRVGSS